MKTQTKWLNATVILVSMFGTTTGASPSGASRSDYYDYAKVLSSEPIYTIERRPVEDRECWNETIRYESHSSSATGVIAGGIIGGIIGNQFGKGHGKQAATVAGTLLGGSIGHDISHSSPRHREAVEERCRVSRRYVEEEQISGYRVIYRYDGRIYTRTLAHDPGQHIRVRVKVEPAD